MRQVARAHRVRQPRAPSPPPVAVLSAVYGENPEHTDQAAAGRAARLRSSSVLPTAPATPHNKRSRSNHSTAAERRSRPSEVVKTMENQRAATLPQWASRRELLRAAVGRRAPAPLLPTAARRARVLSAARNLAPGRGGGSRVCGENRRSRRETASMFLRDFPTEVVKNLKPASREN